MFKGADFETYQHMVRQYVHLIGYFICITVLQIATYITTKQSSLFKLQLEKKMEKIDA